jgi:thiamine biosynthesis lipoprotein
MTRLFLFSWLLASMLAVGCQSPPTSPPDTTYHKVSGQTMGTTYNVTYQGNTPGAFNIAIDSLLVQLNLEVSTYIETSTISVFNGNEDLSFPLGVTAEQVANGWQPNEAYPANWHFAANLLAASEFVSLTRGAFDPTVMPLVNYWGFGYTPKRAVEAVDSMRVDSLLELVGFEKIKWEGGVLKKVRPGVELDFSAIAKGYGVDEVGRWLEAQGVVNYLVEIGGEVRARGISSREVPWALGVNTPKEDAALTDFEAVLALDNCALATSGNYRNYYEVDGRKYAHTINPKTGYPERSPLLSASVVAPDCTTADALATALMVMGVEGGLQLIERLKGVEALLIVGAEDGGLTTVQSSGMERWIKQQQ